MEKIFLLFSATITLVLTNVLKKGFKNSCSIFFSMLCCLFASSVFIFNSKFHFDFNSEVLVYSLLFAISFAVCTLFLTLALKVGNLSISGLIISYSLLLPTFYGIIFLNEKANIIFYIGIILLVISLFFVNYKKEEKANTNRKKSIKWLIFIALAFLGNGFCSIIQTAEQNAFNGLYKNEFMIIATLLDAFVLLVISLFSERKLIKVGFFNTLIFGVLCGVVNGLLNLFVMYSVNKIPSSIVFPLISGGSLFIMFIIARIFFKEKYALVQYIGFSLGIVSIVLLNI